MAESCPGYVRADRICPCIINEVVRLVRWSNDGLEQGTVRWVRQSPGALAPPLQLAVHDQDRGSMVVKSHDLR